MIYPYKDHNLNNAISFTKPSDFPNFFWTFGSEFDRIIHYKDVPHRRGDLPSGCY
jgi:hypothetical protein